MKHIKKINGKNISRRIIPAILSGAFCTAILGVAVLAIALPKPKISEVEQRVLELKPEFSFKKLFSGEYTKQYELYYSDTFPFREQLKGIAQEIESLRGIKGEDEALMYDGPQYDKGGENEEVLKNPEKDAIMEAYRSHNAEIDQLMLNNISYPLVYGQVDGSEVDSDGPNEPDKPIINPLEEEDGSFKNKIFVVGNTAFEIFGRNDEQGEKYAAIINSWREKLPESVKVYNLVIPKNSAFALPEKYAVKNGDQKNGIEHIYSKLSEGVIPVRIFDTLYNHRDEYLFFRTDHHWTQRGAYYAYREFIKEAGFEPLEESDFEIKRFEGYLGTLYNATADKRLKAEPDYVEAFYAKDYTFTMKYYTSKLIEIKRNFLIRNKPTSARNSYGVFIEGDNPLTIITNNREEKTGRKLVVVKESYGNCFVPFAVAHFDEVYVVDQRSYNELVKAGKYPKLAKFIENKEVTDVLFINNMQAALGGLKNYIKSLL